ncbi:unnamed protein product, partial [Ectocarpus fasciculatus]
GWPISFEESTFHGSPMLYDIDGDGKNDIGMVDSDANMYWVRVGQFGQYLAEFHVQVPKLKVRRNWFAGLSADFVDSYVALSMFDRDSEEGASKEQKAKLDVLSVKSVGQASYPGLSSRGRRLLAAGEGGSAGDHDPSLGVGGAAGADVPTEELEEGLTEGAFDGGEHGEPAEWEDDYMRRYRDNPNPFGDGGGSYYHDLDPGSHMAGEEGEEFQSFYSAHRHRHYMDDLFAHSYDAVGMDMYNDTNFAFIDPHVLSSPVLTDVDGDGQMEVLMTISYYFDAEKYRGVDLGYDPANYVAGGVASWSLETQSWNWLVHLDLTTDKSRFKALVYSTPTVADIDGDGRSEIIFGTSLGLLYVLDGESGFVRRFFPMQFNEIQSQVAVADIVGGLDLEIVFGDMGGNVICLSADGDVLWDAKVSGVVTQTPTIGDIDGDGDLDVVVTATAADVNASAGKKSKSVFSKLSEGGRRKKEAELLKHIRYRADSGALGLHLIVAAGDGHIYVIDGAKGCAERIDIGEHVYSMPLVDDLSQDGFLDVIVGTVNGQVLALETEIPYHPLNTWSAFPKYRGNGFTHGVSGISVPAHEKRMLRYADTRGNWLAVSFDIWDARGALYDPSVERHYEVTFSSGLNRRDHLLKKRYTSPGRYTVLLPVQPPDSFLLIIGMTNEHGQYFEDSVTITLCTQFYVWIKYIVCAPVLLFSVALLLMKS